MSKEDLISMHPDADVEYVVREWEKAKSGNAVAISEVVSDEDLASTVDKAKKEKADKKAKE